MSYRTDELFENTLDTYTGFNTSLSGDHRYIHEGKAFSILLSTSVLASSSAYIWEFTTPSSSDKYIHWRPASFNASANLMYLQLQEAAVTTTGGSDITATIFNRSRNSAATSSITKFFSGTAVTSSGTYISRQIAGVEGAGAGQSGGSANLAEHEIVLKPTTKYALRLVNVGATTASAGYITLFWYEETSG